jgi:hypothetical protein
VASRVDGDADEATGYLPLEALADRHVTRVRAAEPHWDTEPLAGPDRDVGAPLAGRRDEGEGEQVSRSGDQSAVLVGGGRQGAEVAQLAVGTGVLDDDPEDVATAAGGPEGVHRVDPAEVGDGHVDTERHRPGPGDRDRLRQHVAVDEEHRVGRALPAPAHQGHRLGDGGGLVEQRRTGHRQRCEVADDGLEVQQRFEAALRDLRLVRRIRGVPGGVLQDVALHDRRRDGAVVAEPDHRAHDGVEARQAAQLADDRGLRRGRVEPQRSLRTDRWGDGHVDERVERRVADDLEHRGDVVRGRADVPLHERGGMARVDVQRRLRALGGCRLERGR